jgi:ABC-type sulfate transport system substrate-binding protein
MNNITQQSFIEVSLEDKGTILIEHPTSQKQAESFLNGLQENRCTYRDKTLISELDEKGFMLVIFNNRGNFESGDYFSTKIIDKNTHKVVQTEFCQYPYMTVKTTREFLENC